MYKRQQQSWPDDATAEKTVVMRVGISSLIDRLVNEITHPRMSTYIVGLVAAMLLIAGIQGAMNRRRWKAHMAYLDAISSESDEDFEEEDDDDLPAPVVAIEEEEPDVYEDDDIELV